MRGGKRPRDDDPARNRVGRDDRFDKIEKYVALCF